MKILKKTNWKAFNKALELGSKKTIEKIKKSGLTGRSGGGFPTGTKLQNSKKANEEKKYIICNAHEGEPGTFKDKFIIENVPENLIEGIAISAFCVGADEAFIYFKHGYPDIIKKLNSKIKLAKKELSKIGLEITVLTGAGAYICGEESAIIDSIEGLRGEPRKKPPFISEKGLFQKPTCVDNVETLTNLPLILTDKKWNNDLRLFSVSGCVDNPGVFEYKLGCSAEELIKKAKPKNKPKAVYFGASGGCIPPEFNMCYENVCKMGAGLGCGSMIIIDEKQSIVDIAKNLAEFFVHESCGKCVPCREGTFRILEIIDKISDGRGTKSDLTLLEKLIDFVPSMSFCGLGKTSTVHLKTALRYFRKEFEEKLK